MGAKKKIKKPNSQSPKRTLSRERRLQSAKEWLSKYEGTHVVRAYAKRYHTDKLCAIAELRMLGITITTEYEAAVKQSMIDNMIRKQNKKDAKSKESGLKMQIDQDENFAFIVGRTSSGMPYGVQWNELNEEDRELFCGE